MSHMSPFASRTLAIHLTRAAASAIAGVTALAGVVTLLRGCPMCWVAGLIETVANTSRRTPSHD